VDVVADVVGFYSAGGRQFTSFSPSRVLDSRNGVGWTSMLTAGTPQALIVRGAGGVPADPSVSGVALSVTVTMSTTDSHLSVSPSGAPPFSASSLNFRAGQTVSNMVVVPIGPDGAVQLATGAGATHVVVDVVGYYR
jgi:hypothetical protein